MIYPQNIPNSTAKPLQVNLRSHGRNKNVSRSGTYDSVLLGVRYCEFGQSIWYCNLPSSLESGNRIAGRMLYRLVPRSPDIQGAHRLIVTITRKI